MAPAVGSPANLVFAATASFLAGIFAASAGWGLYLTLAAAVPAAVFFILRRNAFLAGIVLVFLALGFFYNHFVLNLREATTRVELGREVSFSGMVLDQKRYEKVQVIGLKLLPPEAGKINVMLPLSENAEYGDVLGLTGTVLPTPSKTERAIVFFPEVRTRELGRGFWLKRELLGLKQGFISQFNRFLPADSAALLSGLTFGVRSEFPGDLKEAMSRSGTTHLTALSGYNISILVLAVWSAFGFWLPRRSTFALTVLIIFLFVMMTGGEASIIRAGLMGFLALFARESGRVYSFRNAVVLTAFGMAVFDPTILVHDAGFQLSFLSLLGIVYVFPALAAVFKFDRKRAGFMNWKENVLTTVSAQLAVLPVLLYYFKEFSLTAIVANVLILGVVPYTMFLGFVLAGAGFAAYYFGLIISWLANALLVYEIAVMRFFSEVRLPIGIEAGPILIFAYYAFFLAFLLRSNSQRPNHEQAG